jgi:hypothetical protein
VTLTNLGNVFGGTFEGDGAGLSNVTAVTALTAASATVATNALSLGGVDATAYVRTNQSGAVILTNAANVLAGWFSGDGSARRS